MFPSATSSPALKSGTRCWPSSSPSTHAAFAPNAISPSTTSAVNHEIHSPIPLTATQAAGLTPNGPSLSASPATFSIQSSPEGLRGRNLPSDFSPTPFELPESTLSPPSTQFHSAMSEALSASKSPGLIRRLSRGAKNRLRRRRSSNHMSNRDRSSGPAILRRRSNSKNGTDSDNGILDAEFEADIEDVQEDSEPVLGLGLTMDTLSMEDTAVNMEARVTRGGIAPIVPGPLCRGTRLTKVTKKKRKDLIFILDIDSGKVSWNPSNPSKQFYIDDIQQIRLQSDARNYREECGLPLESESRWFTIIYADPDRAKGRPVKTMHLLAPTHVIYTLWVSTLDDLQRYRYELMNGVAGSQLNEKTLKGHWDHEMAKTMAEKFPDGDHREEDETLDFKGVEVLCHGFHIHCSKNVLRAHFEKADPDKTGRLDFEQFLNFIRRLKNRPDIREIYRSINPNPNGGIPLDGFLDFLHHTQGIDVPGNRAYWIKTFHKHIRQANQSQSGQDVADATTTEMDFAAFTLFLCSDDNNIQNFKVPDVKFDKPLNEYFISSSHNTYLEGRQIAGSSSTEPYIRALQRACRCVEIDCWDGADGRPIVMHGRTLTTSILFSDVIAVIRKHAFESSPYPLILSLEVHCNPEQQQAMVDIMIAEFGEQLLREPIASQTNQLPSPEELRYRILVKVKSGDPELNQELSNGRRDIANGRRDRSFSSPWSRPQVMSNANIPSTPLLSSPTSLSPSEQTSNWEPGRDSMTTTSISSSEESDVRPKGLSPKKGSTKQHRTKIIPSLGKLGVYSQGLRFGSFSLPESKTFNHVFSLAEGDFENLCKDPDQKAQLEKHNMRYLMRVYPAGIRVTSKNPNPLIFWRRGVQMMALNWQTYDLPMQMNDAMFASGSDKLGYVLKPRELRESLSIQEEISEPSIHGLGKIQKKLIRFSVKIISGQQLPRPRGIAPDATLDPYIEIEMFSAEDKSKGIASGEGGQDASARSGLSGIGSPHRRRTHVVQANGFNPQFEDSFKLSLETKYPSLVFVRWTVWNSQDGRSYNGNQAPPLATFTAKLSSLEQGYRHLRLYDPKGDQFNCATLFCKIDKEEPITIEREDPMPEKKRGLKQRFGNSAFKRTLSVEKRNGKQTEKEKNSSSRSTSKTTSGEKSSDGA